MQEKSFIFFKNGIEVHYTRIGNENVIDNTTYTGVFVGGYNYDSNILAKIPIESFLLKFFEEIYKNLKINNSVFEVRNIEKNLKDPNKYKFKIIIFGVGEAIKSLIERSISQQEEEKENELSKINILLNSYLSETLSKNQ